MSILAEQNITNFADTTDNTPEPARNTKWGQNIHGHAYSTSTQGQSTGWGGYTYAPDTLQVAIPATAIRTGPQAANIDDSFKEYQYGPKAYARLSDPDPTADDTTYSSVLGSLAFMINGSAVAWGDEPLTPATRMEDTFTSGSQMRSLWNADGQVASGGQFTGYQSGAYEYGEITGKNGNVPETQVTKTDDITTGIRNLVGMKGP